MAGKAGRVGSPQPRADAAIPLQDKRHADAPLSPSFTGIG
jgi:hypothetical protein